MLNFILIRIKQDAWLLRLAFVYFICMAFYGAISSGEWAELISIINFNRMVTYNCFRLIAKKLEKKYFIPCCLMCVKTKVDNGRNVKCSCSCCDMKNGLKVGFGYVRKVKNVICKDILCESFQQICRFDVMGIWCESSWIFLHVCYFNWLRIYCTWSKTTRKFDEKRQ